MVAPETIEMPAANITTQQQHEFRAAAARSDEEANSGSSSGMAGLNGQATNGSCKTPEEPLTRNKIPNHVAIKEGIFIKRKPPLYK